jgi:hypothetical protein
MKKIYVVFSDNLSDHFHFSTQEKAESVKNKLKNGQMLSFNIDESVDWEMGSVYVIDVDENGMAYPCANCIMKNQFRHPENIIVKERKIPNTWHVYSPISIQDANIYALGKGIAKYIPELREYKLTVSQLKRITYLRDDILSYIEEALTGENFKEKLIKEIADELDFIYYTISSIEGKSVAYFQAVPKDNLKR